MNSVIRTKLSYQRYRIWQGNYNPFSKYTIILASRGAAHYNGSLLFLFLISNSCSLQKIIYSLLHLFDVFIHSLIRSYTFIHLHISEVLKINETKTTVIKKKHFFCRIYSNARPFCANFFIIIKNKCWDKVVLKRTLCANQ